MRACALAVLLLSLVASAFAGWDPTTRLTTSDSASHNSMTPARSIAAGPTGCIHVLFYDNRTGKQQVYYKRSADSGSTWAADTLLSNGKGFKAEPAIAASGGYVHAVWEDQDSGVYRAGVRYRRSTDAGLSWLAETLLASTAYNCRNPSVAAQDSLVHVAWADDSAGRELYYRRSTDYGATWGEKVRLTNDMQESYHPSLALHDNFVHLAWRDWRDHSFEIYYKRSTDHGATWNADARLSGDLTTGSYNPCVAADSGLVHVVWWDTRTTPFEIYYKNSTDDGGTWSEDIRLTEDTTGSYNMTVAARGANVHMMWEALYGTSFIMYKYSTDAGATWSMDTALTVTPDYWSVSPCATMDGSDVHLIWTDFRDSEYGEIYYKRKLVGSAAVEDGRQRSADGSRPAPTIIRGVLFLPRDMTGTTLGAERASLPVNSDRVPRPALLDAAGREVLTLHAGGNDVSGLVPGVYFVRSASSVTKVVIQR